MKPAPLSTAAVILASFVGLVAAGARTARRDEAPQSDPAAAGAIDVRVVAKETQRPVAGATVVVFQDAKPPRESTTDAAGLTRIPAAVRDEGGRIRIRSAGFATRDRDIGDVDEIVVELDPGATAEGVVLELDGRPIVGAHAFLSRGDDGDCLAGNYPPLVEATSAADGTFRLPGVRADGVTEFTVVAPRHVEAQGRWDPASPARTEVRLAPGGCIRGVVRGPSGAPAAGAEVSTWPAESADAPRGTPTPPSTTTDAAGRFEFDGVPPIGAWTIHASKDGFADALHVEAVIDAAHMEAACEPALRAMGRIEVLVLDAGGGHVTEGSVWYDADSSSGGEDVGADGRCVFDVSRPGVVAITADVPCAPPCAVETACAAGGNTLVTIHLPDAVEASGVVIDDLGAPVAGAEVEFSGESGMRRRGFFKRSATTDAAGAFRVRGLCAGTFKVVAESPSHEPVTTKDVAAPGDGLRLVLRRLGRVTMRVRLPADAKPPKQIWITTRRRDATSVPSMDVREWTAGVVEVPLAPGPWLVSVEVRGFAIAARECEVVAAGETPLGEIEFAK